MAGPSGHKRGPLSKVEQTERRAAIWRMATEARTQTQIAAELGITQQRVSEILAEAAADITIPAAEAYRKLAADKLDNLEAAARAVIARHTEHDDPMVLAAVDRVLKIEQRRAATFGYDAPTKVETTTYAYEVNGVDPSALR